ncbi:MAG: hypothetical protein K6T17_04940 [Fimbriimonadales bacterium]|nr:hypothetical protein [Fimbriimonadales bacterium]
MGHVAPPTLSPTSSGGLTHRQVFVFYYPLALSWLLMGLEFPVIVFFISRLPDAPLTLAALGAVLTLSLWIETPVIGLLTTSTALADRRSHYLLLRRFVLHLMILVTLVHMLTAFTPLFGWLMEKVIGYASEIASRAVIGMMIMSPWSAAIGWRRYTQGILIRHGRSWVVGVGTVVRLLGVVIVGMLGLHLRWDGVVLGSCALITGVISEALFVHVIAQPTLKEKFRPSEGADLPPSRNYWGLVRFHTPLTLMPMLYFLGMPLVRAALTRTPDQVITLASWEAASAWFFLLRAPSLALPEAIISLQKDEQTAQVLRSFSWRIGWVMTGVMAMLGLTPLGFALFHHVLHLEEPLAERAQWAMALCLLYPLTGSGRSYFSGRLFAEHTTSPVMFSTIGYVLTLALTLWVGVVAGLPGIVVASLATSLAFLVEAGILWGAWQGLARRKHLPP